MKRLNATLQKWNPAVWVGFTGVASSISHNATGALSAVAALCVVAMCALAIYATLLASIKGGDNG